MRSNRDFGPEFAFDRATRLRVRGGQPAIGLASSAQVRSDVVILNVGVEYHRLAATGVDELLGAGEFYGAASVKRRPCADSRGAPDRPVLHA
ncbi:MAG: hypothetical protein ACRDPF_38090 [Streptosporangiaceae bacterium]